MYSVTTSYDPRSLGTFMVVDGVEEWESEAAADAAIEAYKRFQTTPNGAARIIFRKMRHGESAA